MSEDELKCIKSEQERKQIQEANTLYATDVSFWNRAPSDSYREKSENLNPYMTENYIQH